MYGWIWRHLPGPAWLKVIESAVLIAAAVAFLLLVAFPWAEQKIPFLRVTVDEPAAATSVMVAPWASPLSDTPFRLGEPPRR